MDPNNNPDPTAMPQEPAAPAMPPADEPAGDPVAPAPDAAPADEPAAPAM